MATATRTTGNLDPATPVRRLVAGLVDVAVIIGGGIIYTVAFGTDQPRSSVSLAVNRHVVNGPGVWLFFALVLFHFLAFELVIGASIGKLLLGLRVRTTDGGRAGLRAVAIRTVLRPVDGIPYVVPNLLGFIVLANGPKHQRIGDRIAGTVVVRCRSGTVVARCRSGTTIDSSGAGPTMESVADVAGPIPRIF